MSESLTFELNDEQREVLLRGLRYVRRSIMLNQEDPSSTYVEQRQGAIHEVEALSELISGRPVAEGAAV